MKTLWKKVRKTNGCWYWQGHIGKGGYGHLSALAHRIAYELTKGDIPDGFVIDHICKERSCVNPDHLRIVTQKQNILENSDSIAFFNSKKKLCPRGHILDKIVVRKNGKKFRRCSGCHPGEYNGTKKKCPRGHLYSRENTYTHKGMRFCRKCNAISHKKRRR